ncbi:hypothetical protein CRENBAI_012055 [Crenichthys baileyi]|uniref:Uncharacterized protein n=1 Tax=Crenichthys baileyi TaxID=28760 RepID=A0AAV9QLN3_9TELE
MEFPESLYCHHIWCCCRHLKYLSSYGIREAKILTLQHDYAPKHTARGIKKDPLQQEEQGVQIRKSCCQFGMRPKSYLPGSFSKMSLGACHDGDTRNRSIRTSDMTVETSHLIYMLSLTCDLYDL